MKNPTMEIREAIDADVGAIVAVLDANRSEASLFQQPPRQVRRTLADFVLAVDDEGTIHGCAALHWHMTDNAEILAVAVAPESQGLGLGHALMKACVDRALAKASDRDRLFLWLATAKPEYFARFGFREIPRFSLSASVLWTKLVLVFQQPLGRWLPALVGRHTFMRFSAPTP
ncbi:MAG: GNAT family N-acetyltransferase [Deltaproteobacteria bacterium]|nr:GNAT family N-acetyltransferase [Deltaproteobacteria bacterium]